MTHTLPKASLLPTSSTRQRPPRERLRSDGQTGVRRDKTSNDRASRSPLVMKTRGIVLQGLDFGKGRDAAHITPLRLSMVDPMVDSRSITEGKDVAGMAE